MKIYTRTGDAGITGLYGGTRVLKDDRRIEAYGTVDELNAALGCVRSAGAVEGYESGIDEKIEQIQHELFSIGAELASPDPEKASTRLVNEAHVGRLEKWIDHYEDQLEPLKQFILPGGTNTASMLHLARAVCRRAERRVITLYAQEGVQISDVIVVYLNRLSDLLFVLSRGVNSQAGVPDVAWERPE